MVTVISDEEDMLLHLDDKVVEYGGFPLEKPVVILLSSQV